MPAEVHFGIDLLSYAIQHYPVPVLFPLVFAAAWAVWISNKGHHHLLKKALKGLLVILIATLLLLALFLVLSLGAIGGGDISDAMELLGLGLAIAIVVLWLGIVPFLIVISWKVVATSPVSRRPD